MKIEHLKTIRNDLQRTADELELVSLNLVGHALFLEHSVHAKDAADVNMQIQKLQATVENLRNVAMRLDVS